MNKMEVQGVILCGGQSTRMGTDKGLIETECVTWTELAINKLSTLGMPVVLSVNEIQFSQYSSRFAERTIVKDNTALDVYGPLKGILSIHLEFSAKDLLVLACDMPNMNKVVLQYLLSSASKSEAEAFVFENGEQIEPLCAVYTANGLKKVYQLYQQGQLKKHSLHYILQNLQTCYLNVPDNWKHYFTNYNSPSDLSSL